MSRNNRAGGPSAIDWYDSHAHEVAAGYDRLDPRKMYDWAKDLVPEASGSSVLDIGAGTGRDATWWARQGYTVTAVEPSRGMRKAAREARGDASAAWLDDRLPELAETRRLAANRGFDIVTLNSVLMHIESRHRPQAFATIASCTAAGGLVLITLRHGTAPPERRMHEYGKNEIAELAAPAGLAVVRNACGPDQRDRPGRRWTHTALRRRAGHRS